MGVARALSILGKIGGLAKKGGPIVAHRIAKEAMGSSRLGIARPSVYMAAWGLGGTASILRGSTRMAGGIGKKFWNAAQKHPYQTTAYASIAMGVAGGVRGLMQGVRMTSPGKPQRQRLQPISGPGYSIWAGSNRGSFNKAATGDLSFALHKTRKGPR